VLRTSHLHKRNPLIGGATVARKGKHMEYVVRTNFQGPGFVAVPNHVAQSCNLSPDALGVLVYLASMPNGWTARPSCIMERFKIGRDKWQRIARDLKAADALKIETLRGAGGRVVGRQMVVCWPEPAAEQSSETVSETVPVTENRKTRLSAETTPSPKTGFSAKGYRQTRKKVQANPVPYKDQIQKTGAAASAPALEGAKPSCAKGRRSAAPVPPRAASRAAGAAVPVDPSALTRFQRSSVMADKPVMIEGVMLQSGSPEMETLRQALRSEC